MTINLALIDSINNVMRILSVNSTPNRLRGSKDLLHNAGELAGHGAGPHDAGGVDDVVHGDVSAVLDVLHLLPVPWGLLRGLDDEGGGGGDHGASGLPVLDLELPGYLQTLPVSGSSRSRTGRLLAP